MQQRCGYMMKAALAQAERTAQVACSILDHCSDQTIVCRIEYMLLHSLDLAGDCLVAAVIQNRACDMSCMLSLCKSCPHHVTTALLHLDSLTSII